LSVLLALLCGYCLSNSPAAEAAPSVTFTPSFSTGSDLGEAGTMAAEFTFTGSEYHGSPDPLTEVVVHLPAGVGGSSAGFPTCSELTLDESGAAGCPVGSLAGPVGSIGLDIEEGEYQSGKEVIKRVHETGTIQPVFANPEEAGSDSLFFYAEAPGFDYPVRAHYIEDAPPYGRELVLEFPLIESIPGQPYASITSLTLTLWASREEEAGQLVSSLTIPQECPSNGMFPWAADVSTGPSFAEQTRTHLAAETACPASSGKLATTTTLRATPAAPHVGEAVTYTATVTPKTRGAALPSGSVGFFDEGKAIFGCTAQALTPGAASSTTNCQVSYSAIGAHQITARYGGDAGYFGSESAGQTITVSTPEPPHTEPKVVKPPLVAPCCEGPPVSPTPLSTAQLKALLSAQLMPAGKAATIAALLKHGGYLMPFTAPEAGTLSVQWYELPPGAKLAKRHKSKPVLVASARQTFAAAGTGQLKLKLTTQGKRLLRHTKRAKLAIQARFIPATGASIEITANSTFRR
jgi:hypothetical protein